MKTRFVFSLIALSFTVAMSTSAYSKPVTVACGNATTGSSELPFGGLYDGGYIYQQGCDPSLFFSKKKPVDHMAITELDFSSNPAFVPETTLLGITAKWMCFQNVTITMGQSWNNGIDPSANLGSAPVQVFQGDVCRISTGDADLSFALTVPYGFDSSKGYLWVQVQVGTSSQSAFYVNNPSGVYRVFQPLVNNGSPGGAYVNGNAGLAMAIKGIALPK